jgi:hypothetical protein
MCLSLQYMVSAQMAFPRVEILRQHCTILAIKVMHGYLTKNFVEFIAVMIECFKVRKIVG